MTLFVTLLGPLHTSLLRRLLMLVTRGKERVTSLRGYLHTAAEKYQNKALFLRLGLPSTLIRHENALQTEEFENDGFTF